jgi:tripartite motif-containing protein 37
VSISDCAIDTKGLNNADEKPKVEQPNFQPEKNVETNDLEQQTQPEVDLCPTHKLKLILYCNETESCVCAECVVMGEHKSHGFRTVKQVYEDDMRELMAMFDKVEKYWQGLRSISSDITENIRQIDASEKNLYDRIERQLKIDGPQKAMNLKMKRLNELSDSLNCLDDLSAMVIKSVAEIEEDLKTLSKPDLIAKKDEKLTALDRLTEVDLGDLKHVPVSTDFYT